MGPRLWDVEEIRERGFRTGSIIRVQMHNFITYDDAEVFPGPRLNIILGPNGTGKSTLTHAICLACAGIPSSAGRSDDLRHFIKRGKEQQGCFCEVDLLLKNDTIVTVRRTLSHETKGSTWLLNNQRTTLKEVKELMNSLNIDVNNLCTFMPQDRVSAFTQMNSVKLLQSTLECIKTEDGRNLNDEQKVLSDSQKLKDEAENEVEAVNQEVIQLETTIRGMAGEVERIRNRDKLQDKLKMYDVRLAVLTLEEKATVVEEKQAAIDRANVEFAEAQAALHPFEETLRELQKRQATHDKSAKSVTEKKSKADEHLDVAREHAEELDIQVETARVEVANHAANRRQQEDELRRLNENLRIRDEKYQEVLKLVPQLQEELNTATVQFNEASSFVNEFSDKINNLKFEMRAPQGLIKERELELNRITDSREAFCNKIQGSSPDVIKALRWIDQNRSRFRGNCYGPVGVEVEVKSPEDAAILEKVVSFSRLTTFLVENEEDEKLLEAELRGRLRLRINVTTMHNKNTNPPRMSRQEILWAREQFGFECFLGEKYVMPDTVRRYLNSFVNLQNILCSRGENASELITDSVIYELSKPSFRLFAIDTDARGVVRNITEYNGQRSRFAAENDRPSTRSISVKQAKLLGLSNHAETQLKRNQLEEDLAAAKAQVLSLDQQVSRTKQDLSSAQLARDEHRSMCKTLKQHLSEPERQKNGLLREEKQRDELFRKLEKDLGHGRQKLIGALRDKISQSLEGVCEIHNRCDRALEASIWKEYATRASREVRGEIFAAKEALEEAKNKYAELKTTVRNLEMERNEATEQKLEAERVISQLEEDLGSEEKLNEFFVRASKEIAENSKESLTAKRETIIGQLEATVDNPELITQYEKYVVDASAARARYEEKLHNLNYLQDSMQSREAVWLENVQNVTDKLNKDFGRFMTELNFDGEVGLRTQGKFSDFAVEMKVNFRSDGESGLQPLSGLSHSGGERSVSTVMYLMALQELTSAPFRVVDEINQGMDERNERLVFDRIVRSCCTRPNNPIRHSTSADNSTSTPTRSRGAQNSTNSLTPLSVSSAAAKDGATAKAQYFLVSPKLLPGLRAMDNDDVTALMVYNGPGVNDLWQIPDIISALRKRKHDLIASSSS